MADSTALSRLILETKAMKLTLLPDLGGSVGGLTYMAQDILRPFARTADESPLQTAGFPLFPFSGRISEGRFAWNGRDVSLAPNFLPEPHAIHGQAWHAGPGTKHLTVDGSVPSWSPS